MQILPHSPEAEKQLLGQILIDPSNLKIAKSYITSPDIFYSSNNQEIWSVILRLESKGEDIDIISVSENIDRTETLSSYYITGLANGIPTTVTAEGYAKRIYKKWLLRRLITETDNVKKIAEMKDMDAHDVLDKLNGTVSHLIGLRPTKKFNLSQLVDKTVDSIHTSNLIKCGFNAIDNMTGGMTRGEITVIAGRPGHGKSTFIINIMKKLIERGQRVVMINREMTNVEIMKKLLVMESSKLTYSSIRGMNYDGEDLEEMEKLKPILKSKYKNLIMFDDIRGLESGIAEIKNKKPDVVIDDYIQIIDVKGKEDKRIQIANIMKHYKWLAKSENIPVILVSQLNREIERRTNRRPQLSDLSESGAIEQDAETVVFNYYPWKYVGDQHEYGELNKYNMEILIGKSRYGETGFSRIGFCGNKCTILETREMAQELARKIGDIE